MQVCVNVSACAHVSAVQCLLERRQPYKQRQMEQTLQCTALVIRCRQRHPTHTHTATHPAQSWSCCAGWAHRSGWGTPRWRSHPQLWSETCASAQQASVLERGVHFCCPVPHIQSCLLLNREGTLSVLTGWRGQETAKRDTHEKAHNRPLFCSCETHTQSSSMQMVEQWCLCAEAHEQC